MASIDIELTSATATALAGLIAARDVTAVEVVAAHVRRIADVNGAINAVVALDAERALARAREADDALAGGERWGPLHGVPFTVKDNLSAAGLPMAIGAPERAGIVPDADATAVARLRTAGGILLGKTNCPPYGGGIETDNPVYGRTSNPYDLARTPGGSSGGEAAIIAAVGLIEARPQKWAGSRTLAPESVPSPQGEPPAAMIAASPPLLPPGVRARSYGLLVRP